MSDSSPPPDGDQRRELLELYDSSMPEVYGYLIARCRRVATGVGRSATDAASTRSTSPSPDRGP